MSLSTRLAELRRRTSLTQRELSARIGIHFGAVSHIENGTRDPSLDVLIRWAETCGATVQIVDEQERRIVEALARLGQSDLTLALSIIDMLPQLDQAHRITLTGLVEIWRKSSSFDVVQPVARKA